MEGLWTVEFGSSIGRFGGGVLVIHDGKLMGGDNANYYVGTYTQQGNDFRATIDVKPFVPGVANVFDNLGRNLTVELVGTLGDGIHAKAHGSPKGMPDMQLGVRLTKRN